MVHWEILLVKQKKNKIENISIKNNNKNYKSEIGITFWKIIIISILKLIKIKKVQMI